MEMNLEQLQSFVEVARIGHFTRAAAHLHLAQPSLSRQISTLEQDLGSELFHRARGNITLTAAGEALLPLAHRMLADAETVRHEMQELAGLRKGRVRLGAPPTLCISLVPEVLGAYHRSHPGIDLHLREAGSRDLLNRLAGGTLDLALVVTSDHGAPMTNSLESIPLLQEDLVVIAATNDAHFAGKNAVTLTELADVPQIVFDQSYDLRRTTMDAYRAGGLNPNIVLEGAEMDAVLRLVERGLGAAVVPAMVLVDRPGLRSVPLTEPELTRTLALAHRKDVSLTRAAGAMQEMIVSTAAGFAARGLGITSLA
ncbi:LysR family transcriptional regulator [Arthrobacter sp. GMC3]|uniref:LysR family transcriptional regulator n=1 Tax=Arthrobacter sp. GMC3 TaxID=2058894 RepID=UPI000CE575F0|nr:LysR family transcriptional regulator [Arthrobacter sp. GMC3]